MEGCHSEAHNALSDDLHVGKGSHLENLSKIVVSNYAQNLEHEGIQMQQGILVGVGRNCNRLLLPAEQRSPPSSTYIGHDGFAGFLQEATEPGVHQKANGTMSRRLTYGVTAGKHALRQQARRRRRNTCIATGNSPPITRVTMKSSAPSAACSPSGLSPTNQQCGILQNQCSPQSVKLESSQVAESIAGSNLAASFQLLEGVNTDVKNTLHLFGTDSMARIIVSKLNPTTCGKMDATYNSYHDINSYYDRDSPNTSRISPVVRTSSRLMGTSGSFTGATISGISSQNPLMNTSLGTNQHPQGSRSLRICLPQPSPSNRDSLSPSMTTMQTFLASIPGFKPRKRTQRKLSTAAQLAQTKEGSVDLETPDSILVNINLKSLVNAETYLSLPPVYQQRLAQLLPRVDQTLTHDNIVRIGPTGFHNEFLARACLSWRERLREGEFTHDNQVKLKGEAEKERSKLDPWKVAHFEPVWGMKHGNYGEDSDKDSHPFFDSFVEENDTSFSSSSSFNQSFSPSYSQDHFLQLKKVVEFIASRDKRRKDRREVRRAERLKNLNDSQEAWLCSEGAVSFSKASDKNTLEISEYNFSDPEQQQIANNSEKNEISFHEENVTAAVQSSDICAQHNMLLKRKESPVQTDFPAKKTCLEGYVCEESIDQLTDRQKFFNPETKDSYETVNHNTFNENAIQISDKENGQNSDIENEMGIVSDNENEQISDIENEQYSDNENDQICDIDKQTSDNDSEPVCINDLVNEQSSELECEIVDKNVPPEEKDASANIEIQLNRNAENESNIHEHASSDYKTDDQSDVVVNVNKICRKEVVKAENGCPIASIFRVISSSYPMPAVKEPLSQKSEGMANTSSNTSGSLSSSQSSSPKSPINLRTFIDSSVVLSPSKQGSLPMEVLQSSPSRQSAVLSHKAGASPVRVLFTKSLSQCSNVTSVASPITTDLATSLSCPSKRKGLQGSLYGCPLTLKISKSRGGVNLQRSYEIVQGVIANSPNRDQLKAQLKQHSVLLAESKSSANATVVSPLKANSHVLQVTSDKEPMQLSKQRRPSHFLSPQDVCTTNLTSPPLSFVKPIPNEQFSHPLPHASTSIGQVLPTGQRVFRSVALPLSAISSTGNSVRIQPLSTHIGSQAESNQLGSNIRFIHQNQEGCRPVISSSGPITILRPASGGKPVYLRTLSVSNIHLVRVSDILSNNRVEGDQHPPRASSAPPSRNSIVASLIPRPNSVGPRILIPTSNATSALIPSSTSSPTHHFLSEGDPSSGVISINSSEILSNGESPEGIDAVDVQTRAGAMHDEVSVSQAQRSCNDFVQFYDHKLADDKILNFKQFKESHSREIMHQCNLDKLDPNAQGDSLGSVDSSVEEADQLLVCGSNTDSCESVKSEQNIQDEWRLPELVSEEVNYDNYSNINQPKTLNISCEESEQKHFRNPQFISEESYCSKGNLKDEVADEEHEGELPNIDSNELSNDQFIISSEAQESNQSKTLTQQFYQDFQDGSIIPSVSELQNHCGSKTEFSLEGSYEQSHPAAYQIVAPSSNQTFQQRMLQKQAFFIQQKQQCLGAPIHQQGQLQLHAQNTYQNIPLNQNVHIQQISSQPMALNVQTFTNVNNNQLSANCPPTLSISVDSDGGPNSTGSEDGCPCNMRAMVACMKCGAFCHHDCVSPNRLCVTCLIR